MVKASPEATWSLDREIVLSRVFAAPRELVFAAWTKEEHLTQWFGPKGLTTKTHECDVRVGGRWRFDMIAPDGKVFGNRVVFLEITPPELLVFDHGSDTDDDAGRFRVTITFDEQRDTNGFGTTAGTVVTMRQLHPTKAQRDGAIGFGAVEIGYTTLDKLALHLARMQ
ncbi:MAG: SRPBCC family protein [Polyangiaceae bacterium]